MKINQPISLIYNHPLVLLSIIPSTHLNVGIDAGPPDGVGLPEEDEGPGHHRDVLEDLLLDLGQRGHVGEVAFILARHPPRRIKV